MDAITAEDADRTALLQFVAELSGAADSIEMQQITNRHLQSLTGARTVFFVPLLPSSEEGCIQVVGERRLKKEIRFAHPPDSHQLEQTAGPPSAERFHVGLRSATTADMIDTFRQAAALAVAGEDGAGGDADAPLLPLHVFDVTDTKAALTPTNCIGTPSATSTDTDTDQSATPSIDALMLVAVLGDSTTPDAYAAHLTATLRFAGGSLRSAFALHAERVRRTQSQNLLNISQRLLSNIGDLGQLLRSVMVEAKNMTAAERCSLFLLDEYSGELVSKVFDGDEATREIRIAPGQGIAGNVAQTGRLLNIRDAYAHPLFYKGVDELTGFKTRNLLCFPISNERRVIGVAQLCNKHEGLHFDKCDEQIATAFSVYCGISIMHSLVHKRVQKAEARHKLSQELLTYHMKVRDSDVSTLLLTVRTPTADLPSPETFRHLSYNPRETPRELTVPLSVRMFTELGFVDAFKMRDEKLARFLLTVRKGYRDQVPYHNWTHAFAVAHFAYTLLSNLRLVEDGYLTQLDAMSLLVACFCHDLDHRGTNNSYQVEVKSPLARLYSSEGSVNERHHLSQAICLLNEQNCKILDGLSESEFAECIDTLRHLILATDIAHHFAVLRELQALRADNVRQNKRQLMGLLMTCCDLSDQVREWQTNREVAGLVYAEFFAQGDMEKELGLAPHQMMDRQRACVPQLQLEFIDTCVRPTFAVLAGLFEQTAEFVGTIDANRAQWERVRVEYEQCGGNGRAEGVE